MVGMQYARTVHASVHFSRDDRSYIETPQHSHETPSSTLFASLLATMDGVRCQLSHCNR